MDLFLWGFSYPTESELIHAPPQEKVQQPTYFPKLEAESDYRSWKILAGGLVEENLATHFQRQSSHYRSV
jgi:hypothetical protein